MEDPENVEVVVFGPLGAVPAPAGMPCAFCREPIDEASVGLMARLKSDGTVISVRHEGCPRRRDVP